MSLADGLLAERNAGQNTPANRQGAILDRNAMDGDEESLEG
jgi:hypothetical protein